MSAAGPGRCPICDTPGRRLRAFAERGGERLGLERCPSCRSEYLWPAPSEAWLAEEYASYGQTRRSTQARPKRAFFEGLLRELGCDFSDCKLIDLGAAEGELVEVIERGWPSARTFAVESNPHFRAGYAQRRCTLYAQSIEDWLAQAGEADFDFAFLFDVLEHVRDPTGVVAALVARLRPGATLVASFPCVTSLSRRLLGRLWPQYKVEHLCYFAAPALAHLEAASGLERRSLRPLRKRLPVDYLLSVGAGTGPAPTRILSRGARALVPGWLAGTRLSLGLGESLWVARRPT